MDALVQDLRYAVRSLARSPGLRVAPGADGGMVLREGMALVAAGVAFGVLLALATARVVSSMLFGVGAYDPVTFVAAPSLLVLTALVACYLPARRDAYRP